MPYLTLPGVDLYFEDTGGPGTPVVFLHALTGTADSWVYQVPAFTAAGYRCITYDRRGWGRSKATDPELHPETASDDLHALLESLSLAPVHLVSTAAGGLIALDYALAHPERVRSLVAANTIGGVQDESYLEVQRRARPPEIQNLPVELRELGPSYRATNPEGVKRWLEIDHAARPDGTRPFPPVGESITYARLHRMQPPTLVLAGEADLLAPLALMRMLAAHIPIAQFVSLSDVGHAGFWERPQVWNRMVLEFLGQH